MNLLNHTLLDQFRVDSFIQAGGMGSVYRVWDLKRNAALAMKVLHADLAEDPLILARFQRYGRQASANNRRQAFVPQGAIPVENPVGTAPAFICEVGDACIICVPGVPREMVFLMEQSVLPYLRRRMGDAAVLVSRWVHTAAVGESVVGEAISDLMCSDNPTVGTRAHPGQTDICITAKAADEELAVQLLDAMETQVRQRLGVAVYGTDDDTLGGVVIAELRERNLTLALADSVTGGSVAGLLRKAAGADLVLLGARAGAGTTTA